MLAYDLDFYPEKNMLVDIYCGNYIRTEIVNCKTTKEAKEIVLSELNEDERINLTSFRYSDYGGRLIEVDRFNLGL